MNAGNLTGMQMKLSGGTDTYTYDDLNRLKTATGAIGRTYEYDRLGNFDWMIVAGQTRDYAYASGNASRLMSVTNLPLTVDAAAGYDTWGNLRKYTLGGVAYELTFNTENRLASVKVGAAQSTVFAYDADGQRVMTIRHDGTIIYTPFPDYEVEDPLIGANTVRTTYRVAGQMVALRVKDGTSDKRYYTYTDHLGNVVALSEGSSFVSGSLARYDPFGNYRTTPATTTNPAITNHGFTGHRHNNTGVYPTQNVGLIYMNARYYLPEVGRFVSPDSIVPNPSNPQSYNRYSYVLNSPLNLTDPTGHRECGAKEDCSDPLPHEISQPSSSPVKPQPIQMEEWEKQLLAITAFVEMHGHGTDQAIAIMWVVLNRITGGTTVTGETFHPNTNFSSISKLASYVFCQGQFAIGNVIMGEYKLLEIGNNGDFQLADDLTLQDVVAQGYTRLNTHYNGAVDLILNDVVNPVMAAFNGGENDPTKGSVYYGHLTPDQRSLSIGRLQQYAQVLNVTNQVEYVLIPSSQTNDLGEPVNYLIVNNLMALP